MFRYHLALSGLLAATCAAAGCQDGYPIAPTSCDRFCDLIKDTRCGDYNPAQCVLECEASRRGDACSEPLGDLLRCLEPQRALLVCNQTGAFSVCQAEQNALALCAETTPRGPGEE